MSALSRNPGAFRLQHGVYFTVTHFNNFCSPFSLYQKIAPSIGFHDWSSRATPGTPASTKYTANVLTIFSTNCCPHVLIMSGKGDVCTDKGPEHKKFEVISFEKVEVLDKLGG
jgi:hypothetical protein